MLNKLFIHFLKEKHMLLNALYVGLGGFVGASARFVLSQILVVTPGKFPLATCLANIIGCLFIGLLASYIERPELKLILITGLLGGFTTFSSFSYETVSLFQAGKEVIAVVYVLASCLFGALACLIGLRLSSTI